MGGSLEITCRRKDGSTFPIDVSIGPLADGHVICTVRDDSERGATMAALRHQALHDPLTGLANRTLLEDRLRLAIRRVRRHHLLVCVLFVDLDHFKSVNDLLGHAAGDAVLREVAARIQRVVRPEDSVCRYGGDEFVVVCDDLENQSEAEAVADRIVTILRGLAPSGLATEITASVGVAVGDGQSSAEDLLADADHAAYRAKATGRDRFVTKHTSSAPDPC
jgi:diguanylate cyclase (GGDEF)-like protein